MPAALKAGKIDAAQFLGFSSSFDINSMLAGG
jgi:hypothetical protein